MKVIILIILSVEFRGIKYSHIVVQPSPVCLSICHLSIWQHCFVPRTALRRKAMFFLSGSLYFFGKAKSSLVTETIERVQCGDVRLASAGHTRCNAPFQHPWQTLLVDHLSLLGNLEASSGASSESCSRQPRPVCWGAFTLHLLGRH